MSRDDVAITLVLRGEIDVSECLRVTVPEPESELTLVEVPYFIGGDFMKFTYFAILEVKVDMSEGRSMIAIGGSDLRNGAEDFLEAAAFWVGNEF